MKADLCSDCWSHSVNGTTSDNPEANDGLAVIHAMGGRKDPLWIRRVDSGESCDACGNPDMFPDPTDYEPVRKLRMVL